jgi:hypothetical protein
MTTETEGGSIDESGEAEISLEEKKRQVSAALALVSPNFDRERALELAKFYWDIAKVQVLDRLENRGN